MSIIVHTPSASRLSKEEIEVWKEVPVSVAVDLEPSGQVDLSIRPQALKDDPVRLLGSAVTVSCTPPDFGAVVQVMDIAREGDVIVIAAGGRMDCAVIGDILGGRLRDIGCAGLVVDGYVRDIEALGSWSDFPIFARGINPRGPSSALDGEVNGTVELSGCQVSPGDLIIGDRDGLIALSPDQARNQIGAANDKLAAEEKWINDLKDGKPVAEIFGVKVG